jgi:hypothetical protein
MQQVIYSSTKYNKEFEDRLTLTSRSQGDHVGLPWTNPRYAEDSPSKIGLT